MNPSGGTQYKNCSITINGQTIPVPDDLAQDLVQNGLAPWYQQNRSQLEQKHASVATQFENVFEGSGSSMGR